MLLQASTACQVLVREKLLAHVPAAVVSLSCTIDEVPQASEAVGEVKLGVAVHSMVASLPCPPIAGAVVSRTVMV